MRTHEDAVSLMDLSTPCKQENFTETIQMNQHGFKNWHNKCVTFFLTDKLL